MRDFYTLTIKRVFREKKRTIIHAFVICFSFLIIYSAFTFLNIFYNYMEESVLKNLNFRLLTVQYKDDIAYEEQVKLLNELEHVALASTNQFQMSFQGVDLSGPNRDGIFTLVTSTNSMLPKVIMGREFKDDETGVLICSSDFLPDSKADYKINFKSSDYIKGKDLLNTSLKFSYKESDSSGKTIKIHQEEFTVIGIYNSKNNFSGNDMCYANYQDMLRIENIINRNIKNDGYKFPYVVVDKIENVEKVEKTLTDMGYYYSKNAEFDNEYIKIVNILVVILVIFSSLLFLISMFIYIRKSIKNKSKQIGLLKSLGYNNKQLSKSLLIEQLSILLFGFILSVILYTIGFVILILLSNYVYLNMKVFTYQYPIFIIIISFILYLVILYFTYIMSQNKMFKINPIDSINE